ncbi:acyl-ACP--UDP-N-acetylglucosamine O-acyltransferase [Helicobacter sp. MIT 05-5293]|uniref:acyl-ACP--UDP-N-acetylglucosamine O-acyltransferase n=1 Tax=Helicobacter sp. MIT 05-5293 TaxID=1548149 RepID=UPI00051DDCAA|nr:acyl-ACP--UDP-N-acetylglucosamine O-acyltransferase [Helicobacter sp. MIT 05-5293]TLD80788.1 acyl-ACP--UDP-N-acetylglucosamine O-acyltransferase [Helicobacter sp. MIT 05-5293]
MGENIAKTAVIRSGAKIGRNVQIGEFCIIDENVEIGDDCIIGHHAYITGHTKIGNRNKIFSGAAVGVPPQDLKYAGEKTELIIGDDNLIREFTTLNPGTEGGGGRTIIGNHNLLMAYVHIAHDCIIGNHCILANNATLGGHVEIGDHVNVGGMTPIHQFVKVGNGCMVAGASALTQDLPPYCLAEGNRAHIRGLNKHRMRKLFSRDEIDEISKLYKILFSRTAPIRELAENQLAQNPSIHTQYICDFILKSTRGIPLKGVQGE